MHPSTPSPSRRAAFESTGLLPQTRPGLPKPGRQPRSAPRPFVRGQGMTEYLVIVALIGVAAIGAYSFLGQSIRGATAGLALEIAGEAADTGVQAAATAAQSAVQTAGRKATLNSYSQDNH